jgi:ATP-dependent protease ClpP protease subunit
MIQITNTVDTAKVLISGDIGASFWGEGFTFDSFKEQINGDFSNIDVEIKSNGGDGNEAFAIYDELKRNPARVTVNIVGATASAGTIIAMGGDVVNMADNARFLIHRASTIAAGNIDEIGKAADMLEDFDNRLLNIYQKRTGKRKAQLQNLMKEDKWLTPDEAINWGFVDKVMKTKQNPILNKTEMDTTKIKELLNVAEDDAIQNAIESIQSENTRLTGIVNQVEADKEAAKDTEIANYIEAAVTDGKITDEVKDKYIALAKTDFEAVKMVIEAAKPAPLKNHIEVNDPEPVEMTKAEALKIRNSKKSLQRWFDENPEEYTKVMNLLKSK